MRISESMAMIDLVGNDAEWSDKKKMRVFDCLVDEDSLVVRNMLDLVRGWHEDAVDSMVEFQRDGSTQRST
jgi:hypothetical protein